VRLLPEAALGPPAFVTIAIDGVVANTALLQLVRRLALFTLILFARLGQKCSEFSQNCLKTSPRHWLHHLPELQAPE
jgi:hypothetical protein